MLIGILEHDLKIAVDLCNVWMFGWAYDKILCVCMCFLCLTDDDYDISFYEIVSPSSV